MPTPPSTAHLQSLLLPVMSPPAPSSVRSHHSAQSVTLDDGEYDFLSDTVLTLTTPDKLQTESKSSTPVLATEEAAVKTDSPPPRPLREDSAASRADTMCSSSSENFECSDIDDMLEYFEGVTLPI